MTETFPKYGIQLEVFEQFIEECGGASNLHGCSTRTVCDRFLKPFTETERMSYCECLLSEDKNTKSIGVANFFVSHAWQYEFLQVVECIKMHFKKAKLDAKQIYIWFDLFSNNQHKTSEMNKKWWSDTLPTAINNIGHTLLVLSPWNDPIPLKRTWCLYEIFCTINSNCKLSIIMTGEQEEVFLKGLMNNPEEIDHMITAVNLKKSEATSSVDKKSIFAVVEASIGFDKFNSAIFSYLRNWLIEKAKDGLSVVEQQLQNKDLSGTSRSTLLCQHVLLKQIVAYIHWKQSRFSEAALEYKECLQLLINLEDKEILNWKEALIKVLRDLGLVYIAMENFDDAVKCLENAVGRCEDDFVAIGRPTTTKSSKRMSMHGGQSMVSKVRGLSNVMPLADKIDIVHQLGSILRRKKDYAGAEKYYAKCVKLFKLFRGNEDQNTFISMANLSTMLTEQGKDTEAKYWLDQCVELIDNIPPMFSRNVNTDVNRNFNSQTSAIIPIYKQSYEDRFQENGPDHPNTLHAMINYALILKKNAQADEAKLLLQKCYDTAKIKLGDSIGVKCQFELAVTNLENLSASDEEVAQSLLEMESCAEKMQVSLGISNADVYKAWERIVHEHIKRSKLFRAEERCVAFLDLVQNSTGKDSAQTLQAKKLLLSVYRSQRDKYSVLHESLREQIGITSPQSSNKNFNLSVDVGKDFIMRSPLSSSVKSDTTLPVIAPEVSSTASIATTDLVAIEKNESSSNKISNNIKHVTKESSENLLEIFRKQHNITQVDYLKAMSNHLLTDEDFMNHLHSYNEGDDGSGKEEWMMKLKALLYPEFHETSVGYQRWWVDKRYGQVEWIGHGLHGIVAKAIDQKLEEPVAIKLLPSIDLEKIRLVHCLREIKIAKHVAGEIGFIKLNDIWVHPLESPQFQDVYFVANWMPTDLYQLVISPHELTEGHIQHLLFHIILAVKYLHLTGIMHRDLKPSNILVNEHCEIVLADFSTARGFQKSQKIDDDDEVVLKTELQEKYGSRDDAENITSPKNTNVVINSGMPAHATTKSCRAPELLLKLYYDEKVDMWSIGCIMAELFTRQSLFHGDTLIEQLKAIFTKILLPEDFATYRFERAKYIFQYLPDWQKEAKETPFSSYFSEVNISSTGLDLMSQLLEIDPARRISAAEALRHPYFSNLYGQFSSEELFESDNVPPLFDYSYEKLLHSMSKEEIQKLLVEEISYYRHFV